MLCSLDFFSGKIDPHASTTTNEDQHSQTEIVQCIINNLFKKNPHRGRWEACYGKGHGHSSRSEAVLNCWCTGVIISIRTDKSGNNVAPDLLLMQ